MGMQWLLVKNSNNGVEMNMTVTKKQPSAE